MATATIRVHEVLAGKFQIEADSSNTTYRHFHVFNSRREADTLAAKMRQSNGSLVLEKSPHWTALRNVSGNLAPMSIVCYMIPTVATEAGCPMPCNTFRNIAGRIDGSVWVIPTDKIPYTFLHKLSSEWKSRFPRLRWNAIPIDSNAALGMLAVVLQNMQEDLQEAINRAEALRVKGEAKLAAAEANDNLTPEQRTEALAAFQRSVKAAIARTEKIAEDLANASKSFGFTGRLPLSAVKSAAEDMRTNMEARSRAYSEAAKRAGQYSAAAMNSEVPAGVLADMLDDAGEDTTELRRQFGV